jgi:hypothetical protein
VRCGTVFLWIYTPKPYSTVFLLHAPAPTLIIIGFGVVRCCLCWIHLGRIGPAQILILI